VLGRSADAEKYGQLHQDIKAAFRKAYVAADAKIKGDTQAGYALALHFGLLTDEQRPKALAHLLAAIERYKGHASTGIQSTHRMLMELSAAGHHEEAYRLATLRDAPSWGYSIDQGATTIWERWDGFVKGRGFQDPGMNSFNHYALGSVGEWMWRELAGIQLDEQQPGYKHFVIRPRPAGDLKWVKARYDSIRGPIEVEWEIADGVIRFSVAVPVNAAATIHIPTTDPAKVTESGKLVGRAVCEVGSGCYTYCAPYLDGSRR
jgi:alpha-L-rhamnosidase